MNPGILTAIERSMAFTVSGSVIDPAEVFSLSTDRDLEIEFVFRGEGSAGEPFPDKLSVVVTRNSNVFRARLTMPDKSVIPDSSQGYAAINQFTVGWGGRPLANLSQIFDFFSRLQNSVYIGPFRNAINISQQEAYFDINVGREFVAQWRTTKTGFSKRSTDVAISVTSSIKEIFDPDSLEINASDDGTTLQLIINNRSFRLAEVGAGMAQFVMVLATAAIRQPNYIFIDEPELSLHPSLQLKFLTALESLAKNAVLFATHNIGLARTAEWIYSVYTTSAWESSICPFEATPRLSELVGELSFLGYKDLGYQSILLVEGATELRTIAALFRHFRKDHKVVPLSMNGTNLINGSDDTKVQLEEIRRISNNVFALIDSERASEGAALEARREGFRQRCEDAGVHCHVLERRAIEHYFTEPAIKQALGERYRALGPFEDSKTVSPMWSKHDNWKIAHQMVKEDVIDTDLGTFLDGL